MKTKPTYIERVRREVATVKMQVQNVLGWDDLQYAKFQEAQGIEYLRLELGDAVYLREEMYKSRVYWGWWRQHWAKRDREFLDMANMLFDNERRAYYEELHDPSSVLFRPHGVVMEKAYLAMVHRLKMNEAEENWPRQETDSRTVRIVESASGQTGGSDGRMGDVNGSGGSALQCPLPPPLKLQRAKRETPKGRKDTQTGVSVNKEGGER